ncbi:MAG: hypothetical protein V2A78_08140 [bacterium]
MKKASLILIASLTLILFACVISAGNTASMTAEEIFKKAQSINPELKAYSANLKIRIKARYFPPLRMRADYFFKAPDKIRIKIRNAPAFLNKYPQVFSSNLPDLKDYNCKLEDSKNIGGQECHVVALIPKQPMGDLLRHELCINKENFTIPSQTFTYNNDGRIDVLPKYTQKNGFWLFNEVDANFSFPKIYVTASMNVLYENYQLNGNLPDDLFEKK